MNAAKWTLLVVCAAAALAQPVVYPNGILSAATYKGPIAQGSMFVLFGTGLGPSALAKADTLPLPRTLAGTEILINAGGQTLRAPLVYVSATQCSAVLPSTTPAGAATVAVSYSGQTSAPVSFQVARSNFGAFTNNARGDGPAVVQNYENSSTVIRNVVGDSAKPGQIAILWGTGLGPINGDDGGLPPVGDVPGDISVSVGGRPAKLLYHGRSGCCAGVDQVMFEVPQGVEGCYLPLIVDTGAGPTQNATISVARDGKACTDPGLITAEDLEKARSSGGLRVGSLLVANYDVGENSVFGYGFLTFSRASYDDLVRTTQRLAAAAPGTCGALSSDLTSSQTVGNIDSLGYDFFYDYLFWTSSEPLDAGSRIVFSGNGRTVNFDRQLPGYYFNTLIDYTAADWYYNLYLTPGNYVVDSGSGGKDVPAFQTRITVPERVKFSIPSEVAIPRNKDYVVTWTGGASNDRLLVSGWSYDLRSYKYGWFTCVAKASDGKFAVPASILAYLPASGSYETGQGYGLLYLYGVSPYQRSDVPGLDAFYAATLNLSYRLATFQ